jgi:hypothetical protein
MIKLNDTQTTEYFHRSYTAVDGLWFMKTEERYGFDKALEIDRDVWQIVPKIQARTMKSLTGLGNGIDALREALETKLTIEKFTFETETPDDGSSFMLVITDCPWHNMMVRSGREHLSEMVGTAICDAEFSVWAAEFGENLRFSMEGRLCGGGRCCIMKFFEENSVDDTDRQS